MGISLSAIVQRKGNMQYSKSSGLDIISYLAGCSDEHRPPSSKQDIVCAKLARDHNSLHADHALPAISWVLRSQTGWWATRDCLCGVRKWHAGEMLCCLRWLRTRSICTWQMHGRSRNRKSGMQTIHKTFQGWTRSWLWRIACIYTGFECLTRINRTVKGGYLWKGQLIHTRIDTRLRLWCVALSGGFKMAILSNFTVLFSFAWAALCYRRQVWLCSVYKGSAFPLKSPCKFHMRSNSWGRENWEVQLPCLESEKRETQCCLLKWGGILDILQAYSIFLDYTVKFMLPLHCLYISSLYSILLWLKHVEDCLRYDARWYGAE